MSTDSPANWCSTSAPAPGPESGRDGRLRPVSPSSLCSYGWRPLLLTGLLRDLLTRHFAEPGEIEEPDLRNFIWQPGDRTGILIESIHRWRGTLVEKRPAVIIKRNGQRNLRLLLGDRAAATPQGFWRYQTFWVGSHTLFCLHGSGAGAEILATEVQRQLTQFGPVLVSDLGLYRWQVTELGAVSEVEEAREGFLTPVTVAWAYAESWEIQPESRKLRAVTLRHLLDLA